MRPLESRLDTRAEQYRTNREGMLGLLGELDRLAHEAAAGGGPRAHERLRQRAKQPIRERIHLALDPDSPFYEISSLAAHCSDYVVGGGLVLGIGVISGVECVVMGNDPSVLGGAITTFAIKKLMRGLEIARTNRMPYVQFVESAGADLRGDPAPSSPCAGTRPTSPSRVACSTTSPSCPSWAFRPSRSSSGPPPPAAPTSPACPTTTSSSGNSRRCSWVARPW